MQLKLILAALAVSAASVTTMANPVELPDIAKSIKLSDKVEMSEIMKTETRAEWVYCCNYQWKKVLVMTSPYVYEWKAY